MSDTYPAAPPLAPYLTVSDAKAAIAFYEQALGAEQLSCLETPDGRVLHADLIINTGRIYLSDAFAETEDGPDNTPAESPVTIQLTMDEIDAPYQRAIDAGATPIMPPEDMFWGSRYAAFTDPFGHRWAMDTPATPVSEEDLQAGVAAFAAPA